MKQRHLHSILLAASLLSALLVAPSLFAGTAQAAERVECTGTPFEFRDITDLIFDGIDKNRDGIIDAYDIGFEASGGMVTFDCNDDRHSLEGQTVEASQLTRLGFKPGALDKSTVGQLEGKTILGFDFDNDGTIDVAFKGVMRGSGECDEGGLCTLTVDIKTTSGGGLTLTMEEAVTLDTNSGLNTGVQVKLLGIKGTFD